MSKKITGEVRAIAEPVVSELGYELVGIEYKRESQGMVLTVFIDKPDGITLDDCERVSGALDPLLDENDPIPGSYFLSVSSPGLDRPLKTDADLKRSMGKQVEIRLYKAIEKSKIFVGELAGFDADTVTIIDKDRERELNRSDIAGIRLHIEF